MASPRVFISSTCYDLSEVRDSLVEFIQSFGFEAVLSERGDVFYHPDIHTHDSCLNEVENCQLFILIIGGRFGGSYIADKTKSIVNAEYFTAKESKIPVFTFVKRGVHSDHYFYSKNHQKEHIKEMDFPSMDKREDAEKIFHFIDEVRRAPVNNGYFSFEFAREIIDLLRKQWAGMFFEFLQERKANEQQKMTTNLLTNISDANEKLEDLIKRLYRQLDEPGADRAFKEVEENSIARKFILQVYKLLFYTDSRIDPSISLDSFDKWYEYVAKAADCELKDYDDFITLRPEGADGMELVIYDERYDKNVRINKEQQNRFETAKKIDKHAMETIINEINDFFHPV